MKKQLIALAVAGAVAAPAIAQNVTVYGAVDQAIQNIDMGSESFTRQASGVFNTQRIGFKGSEDLGGGLKANFQIQGAMSDTEKAFAGTSEEQWVGLSGAFGEIRVGTTDMSGLQALDSTVHGAGNFFNSPKIHTTTTVVSGEDGADTGSTIRFISPTVNGFAIDVGYSSANTSAATTDSNGAETSVFVTYKVGNLFIGGGQHEKDGVTNAKTDYRALGARYDFGVVAVGALWSKGDASTSSNDADTKNTLLSVNVPLGNGFAVHGARMTSKIENTAYKASGTSVAVTKALSKRTTVYGQYTSVTNEAGTYSSWGGAANATAANDPKAMTIGVSHTF